MTEYIVLTIVIVLALAAHVWIYLWIRFKADEGTLLQYLQDQGATDTVTLATETAISVNRVASICAQSKSIKSDDAGSWEATN